MKILHTSDVHLGRVLYGRKRYAEFEQFLDWLAATIESAGVDALLLAGDVFDTATPSNRAQELYFGFLGRVARSSCRHVVVIAGNHDSPSFLRASRPVLRELNVHVVSDASSLPDDEVIVLRDGQGRAELIVCAVPHLRDRDVRVTEAGETVQDKERKLLEGIRDHYAEVTAAAEAKRAELGDQIPIIAMGHLFTAGGKAGDGVRDLYVGSLAHVGPGIFPESVDYVALGHLHVPQTVGGSNVRRYSGSPLPMGFGEARQRKSVCLVDINDRLVDVELIDVPVFQSLEQIEGDWSAISNRVAELATTDASVWLEVIYTGDEIIGDLRDRLDEAVSDSGLEVLRIKNNRIVDRVLKAGADGETLDDLDEEAVFEQCLVAHGVLDEQRAALWGTYREALDSINNDDLRAE
ncbi:MAG: exonuclease SbcCD subunit D C-terminal domain-containing protein [Actinomycetes bacterium]